MATRHFSEATRGRPPGIVGRIAGTSRNVRATLIGIVLVVVVLVGITINRGQRVAEWAPVNVVTSRDPLQELPIRIAGADGVVRPAHTYDAVLDLSRIAHLVVGVDLDRLPRSSGHHDVVLRNQQGVEIFREPIAAHYYDDGRFMLRLFSRRFPAGVYWLEIEAADEGASSRVIASSWFEVLQQS
jgi:hypothetical protein